MHQSPLAVDQIMGPDPRKLALALFGTAFGASGRCASYQLRPAWLTAAPSPHTHAWRGCTRRCHFTSHSHSSIACSTFWTQLRGSRAARGSKGGQARCVPVPTVFELHLLRVAAPPLCPRLARRDPHPVAPPIFPTACMFFCLGCECRVRRCARMCACLPPPPPLPWHKTLRLRNAQLCRETKAHFGARA